MKSVKIGLLGLGTVGTGTLEVLKNNQEDIRRRTGRDVEVIAAAVRDLKKKRDYLPDNIFITDDPLKVATHPEVNIVVELMGGADTSKQCVLAAIDAGKHIVTANKALIALHGNHIFAEAHKKGVTVAFEASVAGGIPIIKAIREGLAANCIQSIAGIINGTSNYILTEMRDTGASFDDVLQEAQKLGYAEADPTFDIEGIDAAHKLTILAAIAFGIPLQFDKVFTEGISQIDLDDVRYAAGFGYEIKHLGFAKRVDSGIELRVHPTLVPQRAMLANVNGVMNAVHVEADAVGPTLYYGAGAGSSPTASAVVADLIEVVRTLTMDPEHRVPHLAFQVSEIADLPILPREEITTAFYLRLQAIDKPGTLADITHILGKSSISIEAILQKEPNDGESHVPIIMLTQKTQEKNMDKAIEQIEALETINNRITKIRLESL